MIIGNGDLAGVLKPIDRNDLTFFACGVSNSQCKDREEFEREEQLLKTVKTEHIVYFSSLSIYDKDSEYTRHKRYMEGLVKFYFHISTIVRLGNITWGTNPNTIINYLKRNPKTDIRNEFKYLCTLAEFYYWIDRIPKYTTEMNITGERVHMVELYNRVKNKKI